MIEYPDLFRIIAVTGLRLSPYVQRRWWEALAKTQWSDGKAIYHSLLFHSVSPRTVDGLLAVLHQHLTPHRLICNCEDLYHQPRFKGSECPCHFFGLRTFHTTRRRDRAHHRLTGDRVGSQRSA